MVSFYLELSYILPQTIEIYSSPQFFLETIFLNALIAMFLENFIGSN